MNRAHFRPLPLAVALAAFALNLIFVRPRTPPAPCESEPAAVVPPRGDAAQTPQQTYAQTPAPVTEAAAAAGPARVAQQAVVGMPGVGRVRVTAYETEGDTRLVFEDYDSGKELRSSTMAGGSLNPRLRFKVTRVRGLPDLTVVAVAVSPGGSGSGYEMEAFAPVGGRIQELTCAGSFTTDEMGGFYIGDLGRGVGLGAAVWQDLDERGAHHDPHRYKITFYKWDDVDAQFELNKTITTRQEFDSDRAALRSAGLSFKDVREDAPEFNSLDE